MTTPRPTAVVVVLFGATGDLARRMVMPALMELRARGLMPPHWRLIGSAADDLDDAGFAVVLRESLGGAGGVPDDFDEIVARTRYVGGLFSAGDPGRLPVALSRARSELHESSGVDPLVVFFLAVPPLAFPTITEGLGAHGLAAGAHVVFEKPYGTSLESFEELDSLVKRTFTESQVFRIDHFLGKEGVQAIYTLRFANKAFGTLWDRHSVAQVQVDVPEDLNVANRIGFYEATGAALDPARDVVLGQFTGYRDLPGVAPDSQQDTFVAARLWVDSDRWRGVPFILRTGKMMARKAQRVTLVLRPDDGPLRQVASRPNTIEIDFAGAGEIFLGLTVKAPGPEMRLSWGRAGLDLDDVPGGEPISPYASLIDDVFRGDRSLFTTEAGLRAAFQAFEPLRHGDRPAPLPYEQGGWGPVEANRLTAPYGWILQQEGSVAIPGQPAR